MGEPIGQNQLTGCDGAKKNLISSRDDAGHPQNLNEFELMSWQAACAAVEPNVGASGVDLYWTTRSDGCRYEYWSSDPGDNEYGVLVRIDADSMTAIGEGSDDGLEVFEQFGDSDVVEELIREGWPLPRLWRREGSEDEESYEDSDAEDA